MDLTTLPTAEIPTCRIGIKNRTRHEIDDPDLRARKDGSHRADHEFFPGANSQDWTALCEPVALEHRDADVIEKGIDMRRQGSTTGDRPPELTADHGTQLGENQAIQQ